MSSLKSAWHGQDQSQPAPAYLDSLGTPPHFCVTLSFCSVRVLQFHRLPASSLVLGVILSVSSNDAPELTDQWASGKSQPHGSYTEALWGPQPAGYLEASFAYQVLCFLFRYYAKVNKNGRSSCRSIIYSLE